MDINDAMYFFQHKILPNGFFTDKMNFIGMLIKNQNVLFEIISGILSENNINNPFSAQQFSIISSTLTNEIGLLKITFPEPLQEPQCYYSYLIFDTYFKHAMYFCVEKDNSSEQPMLCAWTADGFHYDYENCNLDDKEIFTKCSEIFVDSFQDLFS